MWLGVAADAIHELREWPSAAARKVRRAALAGLKMALSQC